jgi:hypothetical protein
MGRMAFVWTGNLGRWLQLDAAGGLRVYKSCRRMTLE